MNDEKRAEIFRRFQAINPAPKTELLYSNHFELLVAVILSAQATDVSVNKATPALFTIANTPKKILALGEEGLKHYLKTLNLYKTKSKNIIKTCEILIDRFQSHVPDNRDDLMSLPGVGRKTANVVLSAAFGQATIAVDTHIFRVANRTGLAKGKNVSEVELKLLKYVPKEFLYNAHHWLVLHGRYICTARKPKCPSCPIQDLCEFKEKTTE
jgi:endonuclease-3